MKLGQRLEAWTRARGVEEVRDLSAQALERAAADLGVSVADLEAARASLVEQASRAAEDAGARFSDTLAETREASSLSRAGGSAERSPALSTKLFAGVDGARLEGVTPLPTETLEGPLAGLEELVDDKSGTSFEKRPWARLSDDERSHLAALGYDASRWDAVRDGFLGELPDAWRRPFAELSSSQRSAAAALGYDASLWDATLAGRRDLLDNDDLLGAFSRLLAKGTPITKADVEDALLPEARDGRVETPSEKRALLYLTDFHGHRFTHEARRAIREDLIRHTALDQAAAGFGKLEGSSPVVANDASAFEATLVRQVVKVSSPEDVRRAIATAKVIGAKVSVAGRRHSEGGHTVSPAGIQLDMMSMNRMQLLPNGNLRVEAGATWAQVQEHLARHGRTVKIMQSSNIFTVGGSVGVNCHGRTPGEPPLISTVRSLRVMTADGEIKTCSREENPELFRHVVGGYGLFGVVLDVELETRENTTCEMEVELASEGEFLEKFDAAARDPDVQLAWGRLDPSMSGELLVHRVKSLGEAADAKAGAAGVGFESKGAAALSKAVFHLSKLGPFGLEARWALEKKMRSGKEPEASLTEFSSPSVEMLNQYWFNEGKETDLLHEYYVPRESFRAFVAGLKRLQDKHGVRTLNCTIRDVGTDEESALRYAKGPRLALVLYYNQDVDGEGVEAQRAFTRELIDLAAECGGSFYLPYQRHYTKDQLERAYPEIDAFFAKKRELDPDGVFSNKWYETYGAP